LNDPGPSSVPFRSIHRDEKEKMAEFRSLWTDDIMGIVGERNKGHVSIHNPSKQLSRPNAPVPSKGGERFADSWRGTGPFAQFARSTMLDGQLGVRSAPLHQVQELFSSEVSDNTPQVVTRKIKPLRRGIPGIRRGEICLLLQNDRSSTNIIEMEDSSLIQGNPLCILGVKEWNDAVVKDQKNLWGRDPAAYHRLTPMDIFRGWKVDGIMLTDDLAINPDLTDRIRTVTITIRNRVNCKSYWKNVRPGSQCYMVIKKYDDAAKQEVYDMRKDGTVNKKPTALKPFTIGFYTATYGEEPPMEVYQYTSEDGTEQNDALVIDMGSVLATPMGPGNFFSYSGEQSCQPYTEDMEGQDPEEYTMLQLSLDIRYKM
jgi:hypothetical protein